MSHSDLINKISIRKNNLDITTENISKLCKCDYNIVDNFFIGKDVQLSVVLKITELFGLDIAGHEVLTIEEIKEKRANKRALYIVGLTQDTSTLEMQGLEEDRINILIEDTKDKFLNGEYKNNLWDS